MADRNPGQENRFETTRRAVLGAVGAGGLAGVAGCLGDIGGGGGSDDTVKYGMLNPMTGPYAGLAEEQRKGAKLAVKTINESDDYDFTIDAEYGDTQADAETGQQEARRMVEQHGASYMMGAISSSVALGLNEFASEESVVYSPGAAAIPITGENCNKYVFRSETNTAQIAEACSEWTLNNLGSNVWFHIADYAYGQSVLREWRSRMQESNADFSEAGVTRAQLGAKNFDSFISQMKNSDADVVVVGSTGGDLIEFLNQANAQGLTGQKEIMTTTASFQVVRGALGEKADGIYSGTRYVPQLDSGTNQEFVDAYTSANNSEPDSFARVAYDSITMVANGIKEAGSTDPDDVIETLPGLKMQSLLGENEFRSCDHQAKNPVWVGQNVYNGGEMADVELITEVSGDDAIPACDQTGCQL
ncbi:amino acid/amide ABC transporter substrate-binding protein, HAAT family [Haladaptatus litoreus]|uniref:Amino acid/amide ABC transporter substrate-binding protein, HAAT family n=1 Tax=Haladaptatus litoreus TaxID=553468 RepID=A0A1N7DZ82_9EURY|nr:ABC transporter substrate-binding protein [Haladaptatus litoreus]SIR81172.1 amino acid/amide ABC transporter substrate-binding protein, HAAT family [Haladaptatus litoreus]